MKHSEIIDIIILLYYIIDIIILQYIWYLPCQFSYTFVIKWMHIYFLTSLMTSFFNDKNVLFMLHKMTE
jgi:hypothetical protein